MMVSALKGLVAVVFLLPASDSGFSGASCPSVDRSPAAEQRVVQADGLAGRIRPEVRLRKLHLVRPDLIPYPIAHEVYC